MLKNVAMYHKSRNFRAKNIHVLNVNFRGSPTKNFQLDNCALVLLDSFFNKIPAACQLIHSAGYAWTSKNLFQ